MVEASWVCRLKQTICTPHSHSLREREHLDVRGRDPVAARVDAGDDRLVVTSSTPSRDHKRLRLARETSRRAASAATPHPPPLILALDMRAITAPIVECESRCHRVAEERPKRLEALKLHGLHRGDRFELRGDLLALLLLGPRPLSFDAGPPQPEGVQIGLRRAAIGTPRGADGGESPRDCVAPPTALPPDRAAVALHRPARPAVSRVALASTLPALPARSSCRCR